jgi:hypothetical protein
VVLILTSIVLLFKEPLHKLGQNEHFDAILALHRQLRTPMTVVSQESYWQAGNIIFSWRRGTLGAATLFFLYPRMPAIRIAGADTAHAVLLTAVASRTRAYASH